MSAEKLELVLYPDPILKRVADPLATIDDLVRERVRDMFEIMYEEEGVGLAAPQVGWGVRLFVMNAGREQGSEDELVFINPRILASDEEKVSEEEGCLSIPDVRGRVQRPRSVRIEALNLAGERVEVAYEGLPARVFQHELDHLDGLLFIARLAPSDRLFARKILRKLEKQYRERTREAR